MFSVRTCFIELEISSSKGICFLAGWLSSMIFIVLRCTKVFQTGRENKPDDVTDSLTKISLAQVLFT